MHLLVSASCMFVGAVLKKRHNTDRIEQNPSDTRLRNEFELEIESLRRWAESVEADKAVDAKVLSELVIARAFCNANSRLNLRRISSRRNQSRNMSTQEYRSCADQLELKTIIATRMKC
jgi:hypothetical protein